MPAISPDAYKRFAKMLADVGADHLRLIGLSSMIVGVLLITFAR